MAARGSVLRLSQQARTSLRSNPVGSVAAVPRRFNSSVAPNLPDWAADNEFNRERDAVKEHAVGTSSTYYSYCNWPWWI